MPAVEILCIQTWPKKSGIPEDAVQNQWVFHYGAGAPIGDALDDIVTNLISFWTDVPTLGTNAPQSYMGACLTDDDDQVTLDFYDITAHLDGTTHGVPIGRRTMTLTPSASISLPGEVATVLTYHRPYVADPEFAGATRPRARDRGRLYFGPLSRDVILADVVEDARLLPACYKDFVFAAVDLMGHVDTTRWAQWSRVNADIGIVSDVWMDNAFDTQRRRGVGPTVRWAG